MTSIDIREGHESDLDFILHSWLRTYRNAPLMSMVRKETFFENHEPILRSILAKKTCVLLIATPKDEPDIILGYLVCEPERKTIHYIYTKGDFRNYGIARSLIQYSNMDLADASFTHWTHVMNHLSYKFPKLTYDPYRR